MAALGIVKYLDPDNTVVLNEVMEAVKTRCFHFSAPSRKRSAEVRAVWYAVVTGSALKTHIPYNGGRSHSPHSFS